MASAQDHSTTTHFTPVPIEAEKSFRVSGAFNMAPLRSGELEAGFVYRIGAGFDVGVGIHGGITKIPIVGILGGGVLVRFLTNVQDVLFWGFQSEMGLTYSGIKDISIEPERAVTLPFTFNAIFGGTVLNDSKLYVSPAVELGQSMRGGDVVWRTGIGLRLSLGAVIPFKKEISMFIETRPVIADLGGVSPLETFNLDASLGLLFDF